MKKPEKKFDRTSEDMGNIVGLEHVNICVPDQRLATLFYITGLGLTRDPYLVTGVSNMWINIGRNQMHLPTAEAQILRGTIGLVMPDLKSLLKRLEAMKKPLAGTRFGFKQPKGKSYVEATCPWGNRFRVHKADASFAPISLGMPYVEFDVRPGAADPIARFYRQMFGAPADLVDQNGAPAARVSVGLRQHLIFRESKGREAPYDRHHIQIYLANFSVPHAKLKHHGLLTQESSQHQYRFENIVDLANGEPVFTIEHEVRSMTHPLYARALVNRNPEQTNASFTPGYEGRSWAAPVG